MSGNTENKGFFKKLLTQKSSCCSSIQYEEIRVEIFENDLTELPNVSDELSQKNIGIRWYSFKSDPDIFNSNPQIKKLLNSKNESALPVTLIDGQIKKTGAYPTRIEILEWLGLEVKKGCDCGGLNC
ncbi:MAG: arsenic metallochaperone ArsD family protein [Candidatus Delongbacteria bacterium]|jgi:hypothetical protein|nr:arsenic metallochaperone ArsD family protein [Candidatus Delongbacteria bacterium]MDD4204640.1 arsenic metallochaperone ArsD family protein [Candidatus Delongbacteria bacterium]